MDNDGDGEFTDYTGSHSTLAVYGNSNIHLKNFQPNDYVTPPSIYGPASGNIDTSIQFSASSIDSHGHDIQYRFDWGDGSSYTQTDEWYSNGDPEYASHTWESSGTYYVRAQARCPNGGWSSWSTKTVYIVNPSAYHWLTVNAYDVYNQQWINPYVYIEGYGGDYGEITTQVPESMIAVGAGEWYYPYYLKEFSDSYGNGEGRPIYSDTEITAIYDLGG